MGTPSDSRGHRAQETRVWIAQCLCPQRHAIMASSGEAQDEQDAAPLGELLRTEIDKALQSRVINPWCGLCRAKSETWHYELGRTRFRTMAEAEPHLKKAEAEQLLARLLFGDDSP